ncbi:Uncharacterised protein [Trueperella bialowiezensis]|uniref:Uncharacterized protein n=1 Tax=Trueperella bialowiezensis TaxID=312285 RepID=A0A448PEA9_9ACTO|nr:Uncharacterised protein [Trueperella bialowiezensis]
MLTWNKPDLYRITGDRFEARKMINIVVVHVSVDDKDTEVSALLIRSEEQVYLLTS